MARSTPIRDELIEVRRSRVHGKGVFAAAPIASGARLIEYAGERVSHKEADRRYETKDENDNHTFLFIVDSRTVIDAGVDGNDARFFNHSCDPNCESVIERGRVYIESIRDAQPGEELTYDYQIQREEDDPPGIDEIFACRCGAPQCRGTMLWPPDPKPGRRRPRKKTRKDAASRGGKQETRRSGKGTSGKQAKRRGGQQATRVSKPAPTRNTGGARKTRGEAGKAGRTGKGRSGVSAHGGKRVAATRDVTRGRGRAGTKGGRRR